MGKSIHLRERRLRNVSVGYDHACAIEVDSSMNVCWGSNLHILEDEDGHGEVDLFAWMVVKET